MPATQFVVIYSPASNVIRQIVEDDTSDDHVPRALARLKPGERAVVLNIADHPARSAAALAPAVAAAIGAGSMLPSQRSALIVGGMVVGAGQADPTVDRVPNATLIAHDSADVGHLWDGTSFRRRVPLVNVFG